MRTAIVLITILLNSAFAFGQIAEFSFEQKPAHKFKRTLEGPVLSHDFKFINTGDAPLIISGFMVACKCTKAIYPEEPVMPGETGTVTVTLDTKGKEGWQDRIVELYSNAKENPKELRIKVMVDPIE